MAMRNLLFAGLATSASAVQLITSAFGNDTVNGSVTTFDLSGVGGAAKLEAISKFDQAGAQPTWLDLSLGDGQVIYIDEAWSGDASVGTLKLGKDGKAARKNVLIPIVGSPVAIQAYNNKKAISIAHYGTGSITTYSVGPDGFKNIEVFKYSNATHGPKPQQADGSHVHHAVLDPSGQYIVYPDLGLDAVHVYCIDSKTNKITAHDDIKAKAGYGPRHAAFWKKGQDTFLFVVHELESRITSYKVKYSTSGIAFEEVDDVSSFGDKPGNTTGSAAAEIVISPDNKFVLASNRLSPRFTVPNPDPTNSTQIPSDSIVTYQPQANGKLKYVQLAPSGGLNPRHFSLNKDGSIISIGNGGSFKPSLDLYTRDTKTGLIGKKIASSIDVGGGINNVRWIE